MRAYLRLRLKTPTGMLEGWISMLLKGWHGHERHRHPQPAVLSIVVCWSATRPCSLVGVHRAWRFFNTTQEPRVTPPLGMLSNLCPVLVLQAVKAAIVNSYLEQKMIAYFHLMALVWKVSFETLSCTKWMGTCILVLLDRLRSWYSFTSACLHQSMGLNPFVACHANELCVTSTPPLIGTHPLADIQEE